MTYAKVIADSISPEGDRLTTFEVEFHRFVLAEFNTHRVFSRNSASSRAIPVGKQLLRVSERPAVPVEWPSEQSGMQGGAELDEGGQLAANNIWLRAKESAVRDAQSLVRAGVHKSVTNRLLEPFMHHVVVVSATNWQNFFDLRCNTMAQPEIRVAAQEMYDVYKASDPKPLDQGEWHLPYIQDDERPHMPVEMQVKVSAARCARVSYLTHAGVRDFEQDVQLYDRLTTANPMHASPLEHVATPASANKHVVVLASVQDPGTELELTLPVYGNFVGYHQHRFDVEVAAQYRAYA